MLSIVVLIFVFFDYSSYVPSKDFKESDLYIFREIENNGKTVKIYGIISDERDFGFILSNTYRSYEIDGDGNYSVYDRDARARSSEDIGNVGDEVFLKLRYYYEKEGDAILDYWEVIEFKGRMVFYYQMVLEILVFILNQ